MAFCLGGWTLARILPVLIEITVLMGSRGSIYIPVKNAFCYSYSSSQEFGVLFGEAITPKN